MKNTQTIQVNGSINASSAGGTQPAKPKPGSGTGSGGGTQPPKPGNGGG
jgi:hypothetical protein